jgi:transcription-repair coupling factor (superfamily II helicase)
LHLALSGLREISTMTTSPQDRRAIETFVRRFDDEIIRKAIRLELARQGQVYFVHSRIFDIEKIADKIRRIVPELKDRVAIAHGQMGAGELETHMKNFIDGKYDVLVSTNIIESGLDIPKVNTIFINNADDFGLSDLHQLRGRVGRYKHQAYAYFFVPPETGISTDAVKRLKAIEEFNELGAGFKIAMRDMEIRGVGNILGKEQHGHIAAVGYELYCKLLEKTVKQMKKGKKSDKVSPSEPLQEKPEPVQGETTEQVNEEIEEQPASEINLKVEAFLPEEYVPSEKCRLEIYRRLACLPVGTADTNNKNELSRIEKDLKDRFGSQLPEPAKNLLGIIRLKILMAENGILSVTQTDEKYPFVKSEAVQIVLQVKDKEPALGLRKQVESLPIVIDERAVYLYLPACAVLGTADMPLKPARPDYVGTGGPGEKNGALLENLLRVLKQGNRTIVTAKK